MKILFKILPYIEPINAHYSQAIVGLAEGFEKQGVEFFGNIDYWYNIKEGNYLIKKAPKFYKAEVEIHSIGYRIEQKDSIKFNRESLYVLVDDSDGNNVYVGTAIYSDYNRVLKCHYNSSKTLPKKVSPWVFGLTNRIVETNLLFEAEDLQRVVYFNHRLQHGVRELMTESIKRHLKDKFIIDFSFTETLAEKNMTSFPDYWAQTGRRHNLEYFKKLNQSVLTFCFGGNFEAKYGNKYTSKMVSMLHRYPALFSFLKGNVYISQFDSFRIWETFASNSIPLYLDMEYWGLIWPIMPISGKHYIGAKSLNFNEMAEMIMGLTDEELKKISAEGKQWVFNNYAPVKQASLFLSQL